MKENFFEKTLLVKIFCVFILCQRERKRHWVIHKARPCVFHFCVVDHFILGGRHLWALKHHSDCVRGEICFKEIVSNTRLNLNHPFFTHLVCEFLIIYKFLYIYIYSVFVYYSYLSYLFVILLIFRSVCYSFCFITKVNYWNISNNARVYNLVYLLRPLNYRIFCSNDDRSSGECNWAGCSYL